MQHVHSQQLSTPLLFIKVDISSILTKIQCIFYFDSFSNTMKYIFELLPVQHVHWRQIRVCGCGLRCSVFRRGCWTLHFLRREGVWSPRSRMRPSHSPGMLITGTILHYNLLFMAFFIEENILPILYTYCCEIGRFKYAQKLTYEGPQAARK